MRIGIVSDTHDRVLASLHAALAGVDEILHAGDIMSAEALAEIETIAPVTAVRGNMDDRAVADRLPKDRILERDGVRIVLVHGHRVGRASVDDLARRYGDEGVDLVIWGHIHVPVSEVRDEVTYFNPGTAGGLGTRPTCGMLITEGGRFTVEHLALG